jgi:hypothetical protein
MAAHCLAAGMLSVSFPPPVLPLCLLAPYSKLRTPTSTSKTPVPLQPNLESKQLLRIFALIPWGYWCGRRRWSWCFIGSFTVYTKRRT